VQRDLHYMMRDMAERTKALNVRITDDEDRMLKALAGHQGMSISDVIRQYIRRAFAEAFPPKKTKR
jgi:uncharacterized protein (DUF1778 family)